VGSGDAGTTSTKYYLVSTVDGTTKDLQGNQVVPPLDHGQTFSTQETLTVRQQTPNGQYKVQACADGGNDVVESIETDNPKPHLRGIVKVVGRLADGTAVPMASAIASAGLAALLCFTFARTRSGAAG
jgi:hypothetical protein